MYTCSDGRRSLLHLVGHLRQRIVIRAGFFMQGVRAASGACTVHVENLTPLGGRIDQRGVLSIVVR